MATYLLGWNPKKWVWGDLEQELETIRLQGKVADRWSCGKTKTIEPHSRFFLMRLGDSRRGVVGSGHVRSKPRLGLHWDPNRAKLGHQTRYVDVEFDALHKNPLIGWAELNEPPLNLMHWGIQMSGVRIPESVAAALEKRWAQLQQGGRVMIPEEVRETTFWEGAVQTIVVNAYERDPAARAACIAHYGPICAVCGFDFEERYGSFAAGYIHVHHLVPISKTGKRYRVDPIKDLRPVCPNCHAVIHLRRTPYKVEEIKKSMRKNFKTS